MTDHINKETGEIEARPVHHKCWKCGRIPYENHVQFGKNKEHGNAAAIGIQSCGSVWRCPVCREKIIKERSEQLQLIESYWLKKGGKIYMATYTIPHYHTETAGDIYGSSTDKTGLSGCMAKLRQSACWSKHFRKKTGYVADVRTVETTYGRNGYHIHIHQLIYADSEIDIKEWEPRIRNKWNEIIQKVTGKQGNNHSFRLEQWHSGSEYLAKWGSASELMSENAKQAKNGNVTISELEYSLINEEIREHLGMNEKEIIQVLRTYYDDMDGNRLMQWGGKRKFKKEIIAQDKTDQEIVDQDDKNYTKEVQISSEDYIRIYNSGQNSKVLSIYELWGLEGLIDYFEAHHIEYQILKSPPISTSCDHCVISHDPDEPD